MGKTAPSLSSKKVCEIKQNNQSEMGLIWILMHRANFLTWLVKICLLGHAAAWRIKYFPAGWIWARGLRFHCPRLYYLCYLALILSLYFFIFLFFLNVGSPKEDIFLDHLLWSIFLIIYTVYHKFPAGPLRAASISYAILDGIRSIDLMLVMLYLNLSAR